MSSNYSIIKIKCTLIDVFTVALCPHLPSFLFTHDQAHKAAMLLLWTFALCTPWMLMFPYCEKGNYFHCTCHTTGEFDKWCHEIISHVHPSQLIVLWKCPACWVYETGKTEEVWGKGAWILMTIRIWNSAGKVLHYGIHLLSEVRISHPFLFSLILL